MRICDATSIFLRFYFSVFSLVLGSVEKISQTLKTVFGETPQSWSEVLAARRIFNKLTSLPMCGFIAQLVEHRTGIAEVTGSNPVEALIFSGFFFPFA